MENQPQPLRYFSHSRSSKDQDCRRARYLGSEWGGTGLEPLGQSWDRVFGNIQHSFLQKLAENGKIDYVAVRKKVVEEAQKAGLDLRAQHEWQTIAEGQLRGFVRCIWPYWMAEYEIVETERLRSWEVAPGYVFRFRQDILLRNRIDGHIRYPDYKTTGSDDDKWVAAWAKSPQLHSSMYAIKHGAGVDVQHALVPGLFKGYKDRKTKLQRSVFSYGYVNREFATVPSYSYEYKRAKGWELFSTYDEFPTMEGWVNAMPLEILTAQFPTTAPVFLNEYIAGAWFRQQLLREEEVREGMYRLEVSTDVKEIEHILDKYFPQNFSKCKPAYGFECEFQPCCWIPWVGADPLGSNQFVRRDHDYEEGAGG